MSDNDLKQQVIHHLAEQGVPADYDPWKAVKAQLENNSLECRRLQPSRTIPHTTKHFNPRIQGVLFLLLVLLVGAVIFLTPQGQVAANNIFQFFRRADSDVLPLPTGLPPEFFLPTRTPVPTQYVNLQAIPIVKPGSLPTPTPKGKTEYGTQMQGLTLAEAEELAQFPIRTLASLPAGYQLTDLAYDSSTRTVTQIFEYFPKQASEMIVLSQALTQADDLVGQSAEIDQIPVGETIVETVDGSWFTPAGSNQEVWYNDGPPHTYCWQQDGFTFKLRFWIDDTFSPAYLTKDDMQAVVELVMGTRLEFPDRVNLNNLSSVEEAEQIAGYQLLSPALLPEGFVLERVVYEPENYRAVLIYQPEDTAGSMNHPDLIIYEILKDGETPSAEHPSELPPEAIETVTIGGIPATFQRGAIVNGTYDPSICLTLHWETEELMITINYFGSSNHPAQLEKEDLIAIAESLQ